MDTLSTPLCSYELCEKVGQGSFGVVRRAISKKTRKEVAIKQLVHICDVRGMIRRVLREIRIMKRLKVRGIILILIDSLFLFLLYSLLFSLSLSVTL
jgi:serine/threonine protein kinase